MKKTNRGFNIYTEFVDTYKSKVVVQESSSVLKRCWIYVHNDGKNPASNLVTDGAIHLDVKQAKYIIKALEKFIND
jgi:hypothetical protein